MRTITTIGELRAELAPARRAAARIGLVPTMGALHEGHLSLMRRARAASDVVVVSLFVNPSQFNDPRDLAAYPRDEARDAEVAAAVGVDVLFAPDAAEMYPDGFATTVTVGGVSGPLEGAHRGRAHFDGVATVVCKLLTIVGPDVAYFGQKDAQQVAVVRRLVADLHLPVRIEVCPTVRDPDGLALSSRNALLEEADRRRAPALSRALAAVRAAVLDGELRPAAALSAGAAVLAEAGIEPEYLALVDPLDFEPVASCDRDLLAVVAAQVGPARLIDNLPIPAAGSPGGDHQPVATLLGRAPTP